MAPSTLLLSVNILYIILYLDSNVLYSMYRSLPSVHTEQPVVLQFVLM